ncbi:uncharacterized protein LOC126766179 [Bactrocera neohumeralis]|uniref:uncharacterized protein LOC126766179 n=1 Tax=Bactrocera neohumeralis TaxID=98809 RepID=UPI0021657248|nr:uncharacterized protein LOC126766179 [Bactrocera neohumeralis]
MDRFMKRTASEQPKPDEDQKKRRRDVSIAWNHFKRNSEKTHGIRNYCGKPIKTCGNTTNLMDHLKHVHADRLKVGGTAQKSNMLEKFVGKSVSFYENDSKRKRLLDSKVMNMIAVDVQPFSCVDDDGFKELMKEMDPRYDVVLPSQYESLKNKLQSVLNDIDFVAITTDLWTSKANEGYITVTCHFVLNSFTLESAILATRQLLDTTNHNAFRNIRNTKWRAR